MKNIIKELSLYILFAVLSAIVIIFIFIVFRMVMYKDCIRHGKISVCEEKWLK